MKISAAVARTSHAAMSIEELDLDSLRPNEVRVRLVASGVCHTDAAVRDGIIPTPLPAVLGHEGAGVVEAVGSAVTTVVPGDHVVMSANSCGVCEQCLSGRLTYCEDLFARNFAACRPDGTTSLRDAIGAIGSNFFGQSSFSTHTNATERSLVKVPVDIDLSLVAPLGCGIQTGAGAILNQLRPRPGSTVAVFGTGAVGTAALLAVRLTGATGIIAVDVVDARLHLARELGATHTINARDEDLAARLREITGGRGIDYALDTTGAPGVLRSAVDALAIKGTAALVGSSPEGTEIALEIGASLNKGWTFMTIIQGSSVPQTFITALIELWTQGRFPFDRIITHYPFTDLAKAFDDSESGTVIKPVVVF